MQDRFKTFTVLIDKLKRCVRKIKNEEVAEYGLKSPHVSCLYYLYISKEPLTAKEIEELSSRLEVARLLKLGVNYIEIAAKTGASTATISRVSKCLSGSRGGYRMVLARIEDEADSDGDSYIRTDTLSQDEADALRAVIACFRSKK